MHFERPAGRTSFLFPLLVVLLWFFSHPYTGIEHDARVYTLMALRWMNPAAYARDPWFSFGSQDDWTIFSPVYAAILTLFDIEYGAIAVSFLGGVALSAGAWVFSRALLRGPAALALTLLLVSVPLCYSPARMFFVMETYATSRSFAIAFSLAAVGAAVRGKGLLSVGLHVTALLLHPIMALSPVLASVLARFSPRNLLATTATIGGGLVCALVAGHLGLLPTIGPDWQAYLDASPLIFISQWVVSSASEHVLWLVVLLLGARFGRRKLRSLYGVSALIAVGGVMAAIFGEVFSPVTLLMQAQLWRAVWFAKVMAVCVLVDIGLRHVVRRRAPYRRELGLAVLLVLASGPYAGWVVLSVCVVFAAYVRWRTRFPASGKTMPSWFAAVSWLLAGVVLLNLILDMQGHVTRMVGHSPFPDWVSQIRTTGAYGLVASLLAILWLRHGRRPVIVVALPLLVAPILLDWDWRGQPLREREARYAVRGSSDVFSGVIRRGDAVLWPAEIDRVWFEIGTSGYASSAHTIGLVFSYGRTQAMQTRLERVALRVLTSSQAAKLAHDGQLIPDLLHERGYSATPADSAFHLNRLELTGKLTEFGLLKLCGDPALDYVIDPTELPGVYLDKRTEILAGRTSSQFLYRCRDFR